MLTSYILIDALPILVLYCTFDHTRVVGRIVSITLLLIWCSTVTRTRSSTSFFTLCDLYHVVLKGALVRLVSLARQDFIR